MHVRFTFHEQENWLLLRVFAKTLSCAVSVVKADYVQEGAATSHVQKVSAAMSEK